MRSIYPNVIYTPIIRISIPIHMENPAVFGRSTISSTTKSWNESYFLHAEPLSKSHIVTKNNYSYHFNIKKILRARAWASLYNKQINKQKNDRQSEYHVIEHLKLINTPKVHYKILQSFLTCKIRRVKFGWKLCRNDNAHEKQFK